MAESVGCEDSTPPWVTAEVLDESRDQEKGCHRHGFKIPAAKKFHPNQMHSRNILRTQRTRSTTNWATSGSGMRAVFLDSGQGSCGTGVFLPRMGGNDFPLSSKPACSPVLLPSRVVQALNLNMDELGLQIKPQKETSKNLKGGHCNIVNDKKGKDVKEQCCSPDIFLPKEWTY